jgi:beta-glucanase (GH16 family)
MAIDVDFTQGEVNSFTSSGGTPTYSSDSGVTFTISESGDAPQLSSIFYIMFGRVEISLKAAPGTGIVSSLVMESDDLDEIDMEWLGVNSSEVQTNYFGKGETTTYNRGQFNPAADNQADFITYTVDWTSERIVWLVADTEVRTLTAEDAETDQYPQTPMRVKFGAWSGGDPSNAAGTIAWAGGETDYTAGPYSMSVEWVKVTDYSTGSEYTYGDTSGNWTSIESDGGTINGNLDGAGTLTVSTVVGSGTGSPTVPVGGIGTATTTQDYSSVTDVPSGWTMTADGKVVPISAALVMSPPHTILLVGPLSFALFVFFFAGSWRP